MGKATKRTKKFLKNNLDKTLKDRRAYQKKKATIERSNAKKSKSIKNQKDLQQGNDSQDESDQEDDEEMEEEQSEGEEVQDGIKKGMSVADFLGGGFKSGMESDDDDDSQGVDDEDEEDEDEEEAEELKEIEEMDDEDVDSATHAEQLSKLAEKDPAFYKYLQENDAELLNFANDQDEEDDDDDEEEDGDEEEEEEEEERDHEGDLEMKKMGAGLKKGDKGPKVVTEKMLKGWQKSMIKNRSLRSFRKLLLAFRSASRFDSQDDISSTSQSSAYIINSPKVFNKLVLTTLKYTPVLLTWHIPYKILADGISTKISTNNKVWKSLRKPISSYFSSIRRLLKGLTEEKMLYVTVEESEKVLPWLKEEKRGMRDFLKVLLDLWSNGHDKVRIASFLTIRKIASTGDEAMMDMCLKGAYHSFIRSTKLTTVHTLPSINLLKNTFSSLYSLDSSASYQHAFGFIRQLAIALRNCIKNKTEESYRSVLNWQFVHCVDAWADVLGRDAERAAGISQEEVEVEGEEKGKNSKKNKGKKVQKTKNLPSGNVEDSPLRPLVYPLVQVALGVAKLMPTSRYFPLRLHLIRSLILLSSRTKLYIPISSILLEIFSSSEFQRKPKGSTLPPLDLSLVIRIPQPYVRTKVYSDILTEETCHLLLFFLTVNSENLGFPELFIPIEIQLKRILKGNLNSKLSNELKIIIEKAKLNSRLIENKRIENGISPKDFGNGKKNGMENSNENPLQGALRLARKVREQKKEIISQKNQKVEG